MPLFSSNIISYLALEQVKSPSPSQIEMQRHREAYLKESTDILEQVLNINLELQDNNRESVFRANFEIARFFQKQGEYKKALTVCQNISTRNQQVLGLEHPDTLKSARQEANLLRRLSRHEEAE